MSSSSSTSLTLPALFSRTLQTLLPYLSDTLPSHLPESQTTLSSTLNDLDLISRMIRSLGVFSDNEEMEDVGDQEMVFMTLGWVRGEVEGRVMDGKGIKARLAVLERSKASFESFLSLLESHSFPLRAGQHPYSAYHTSSSSSKSGDATSGGGPSAFDLPRDPAKRREAKIRQYRLEKELRDELEAALPGTSISSTPLPAILALLPSSSSASSSLPNVNPSTSLPTRQTTHLLLSHLITLTQSSLSSLASEQSLLREASNSAHIDEELEEEREEERRKDRVRQEGEGRVGARDENGKGVDWRLDGSIVGMGGRGRGPAELMDPKGRPTQPFTILPSQALQSLSDRARLQSEVFRNGHRLPTMTIDEYLQEEERRGNFISGGGPAQDAQLTTSEQLALDAEMDGSSFADRREEEKRQKDEKWTRYTDEHKKGEGNTMNRG